MAQLTIKDIAKICNVGVSTVSRAINNEPGISDKTKERIMQVVQEFNYIPNNSARNLKMVESNTIALIVTGIDNVFFQSMFGEFEVELRKHGFDYLLHAVSWQEDVVTVATELMKEKRLKGMILLGGQMERPEERLDALGIPYVLCTVAHSSEHPLPNCPWVGIDDELEGYNAVSYLINKGHRDIALVAGQRYDNAVSAQRLAGYRRALAEHGIPYREELVHFTDPQMTDFSPENGYVGAKELIASGVSFTAMFCMSDLITLGAYKALDEAGVRVPKDCSVIGFDGIELSKYMCPGLTTMYQPRVDMVKSSVELLMKEVGADNGPVHKIYEATLIERDSVITREE
ncbi:MAG: LacI family transcriptional regulator [Lachnospiraceae bacterium]|nr:LacI family transcriptional regulator [Lachnospiraceae bacterium]